MADLKQRVINWFLFVLTSGAQHGCWEPEVKRKSINNNLTFSKKRLYCLLSMVALIINPITKGNNKMGKKKMSFEEMVALRKENHDEFIKTIFNNCLNHVFFDGELMLKSYKEVEKDGKTITVSTDKWIMFTEDEKKTLIEMAKEKWEKEKAEILKECNERYAKAENHPYKSLYENSLTATIICAALEDDQEIPNWLFIKACRLFDKHRENEDILWKSYQFKGFVRWSQVEKAMKFNEHSNSKAKNE